MTGRGREFAVVVAADAARGIGHGSGLPWKLPSEMAYFKRVTSEAPQGLHNAVVMGRKTYESIPAKFRPLKNRLNVVLTRSADFRTDDGVLVESSLDRCLATLADTPSLHQVFVVGGGSVYQEALQHPLCTRVLATRVHHTFTCDTFLSEFEANFELVSRDGPHKDGDVAFTYEIYARTQRGNA